MSPGSEEEILNLSLSDAVLQAWRRCVRLSLPLVGSLEACVEVDASPTGITITLEVKVGGRSWKWSIPINGNRCINISLFGPLSLELCVSNWQVQSGSVSFRLQLFAVVSIAGKFTLLDQQITIPLPQEEEIKGLESMSSENLLPALALMGAEVVEVPAGATGSGSSLRCHCHGG